MRMTVDGRVDVRLLDVGRRGPAGALGRDLRGGGLRGRGDGRARRRSAWACTAFRDPRLTEDFTAERLPARRRPGSTTYAVDWTPGRLACSPSTARSSAGAGAGAGLPGAADDRRVRLPGAGGRPARRGVGPRARGLVGGGPPRRGPVTPSARLMCAVIRSVSSGHSARGRSWPMPSIDDQLARRGSPRRWPGRRRRCTSASSAPWMTRVGTRDPRRGRGAVAGW